MSERHLMEDSTSPVQKILSRYEARPRSGFPTADINSLTSDPDVRSRLHGRIELYLSGIAGYASGADRLSRRSQPELQAARQFLSQSFFDRYEEYAVFRERITEQETPSLFTRLQTAELDRLDLLKEVDRLLQPK